jgi:carboxyl-terminal processing protease
MKIKNLWPVIVALSIIAGIFIGNLLARQGSATNNKLISFPSGNKLSSLLELIDAQYVDTIDKNEMIEEAIPMILEKLDPHSVYIPASELQSVNEDLEGSFGGIGVQFNIQDDTVMVVMVISGGPAEKVGLMAGDRIVMVNDSVFAGKGITNTKVMKALRGKKGTSVKVGVRRTGISGIINFDIERGNIPTYSVDVTYMIDESVGYIKVGKFGRTTYEEFLMGLSKLIQSDAKSVIVDLRGNQGGYLEAVAKMVNEFMQRGDLIVYTKGKAYPRADYRADGSGSSKGMRVVVVIDEWSASASEIFAGAIQDNDRGVVVGRRSFGKGLVQNQIPFSDGSAVRLTISRYYTPSGRSIQKSYENGSDDYGMEIFERFKHGEFEVKDSIRFEDDMKFLTKGGRVVYGGGGVMPDVFVPLDTIGSTPYLNNLIQKGFIYKYAFRFTDEHRKALGKFKTVEELATYLESQDILTGFLSVVEKEWGVKPVQEQIKISAEIIETQLFAYIARNILDNDGFYPMISRIDNTLNEAINIAKLPSKQYNAYLFADE